MDRGDHADDCPDASRRFSVGHPRRCGRRSRSCGGGTGRRHGDPRNGSLRARRKRRPERSCPARRLPWYGVVAFTGRGNPGSWGSLRLHTSPAARIRRHGLAGRRGIPRCRADVCRRAVTRIGVGRSGAAGGDRRPDSECDRQNSNSADASTSPHDQQMLTEEPGRPDAFAGIPTEAVDHRRAGLGTVIGDTTSPRTRNT